jgi:hypothetical protein
VNLTAGTELNGINWSLRSSPNKTQYSISGRVIDSRTGSAGGSQVTLSKLTPGGASSNGINANSDGLFEFKDVEPGTYWLGAVSRQAGSGAPPATTAEITVINRDIDGVTLTITPGITISGRVTFEGPFSGVGSTLGILLQPIAGITIPSRPPQRVQADGTFAIDSLTPGPYRLAVMSLPAECFIREARLGAFDILGQPVVLTETTSGSLQIVVSSNSGELDGIVLDARRLPVPGIEAVLIPDRQRERKALYLKTRTDNDGRFSLRGIPPGNYRLFAWERLDPYAYFDPAVVQQADTQATPVRVTEFSTQSIEVRSIP